MKKSLLITLLVLAIILPCIMFYANSSVTVNGQELIGFSKFFGSLWGSMIGGTTFIFVAFLLIFMFLGGGILMMGILFFMGIVFSSFAFPFMLPMVLPLLIIVGIFYKLKNRKKG